MCKCGCGKQVSTLRRADKMYVNDKHRARAKNARMYRNRKAREKAAE